MKEKSSDCFCWNRVSVAAALETGDAVSAFLFELGCGGLVEEDGEIAGYLPETVDMEDIVSKMEDFKWRLAALFPFTPPIKTTISRVADEDWSERWRSFFQPEKVTENLTVIPAWMDPPSQTTRHMIFMDPGPAFGTGKHPTTILCLREIERISATPPEKSLLDVGTGSGILAIYAAMLGFRHVEGIDVDQDALNWAARNVAINRLERKITLRDDPLETINGTYGVVVANLVLEQILPLLPRLLARTVDRGFLVLSGVLRNQIPEVESALPAEIGKLLEIGIEDEWASLTVWVNRLRGP